jgi:hypothetical protein
VTIANTAALSTLQSYTVPAGEPFRGSYYSMKGFGTYSVTGTPNMTFAVYWGGTGGTLLRGLPTIAAPSGLTSAMFSYEVQIEFLTATTVLCSLVLNFGTSVGSYTSNLYVYNTVSTITVATSTAQNLTVGFTWGTASSSNTITLVGGRTVKEV